jgi:hypothetical protein
VTHKIPLKDDATPFIDTQIRFNPKMKEVVRKEVVRLLDAGIIYQISDSKWVSPAHCKPKHGGLTIIKYKDGLIPTRVILGYKMCIDYRKLNKDTIRDHKPLPNMERILERLSNHSYICFLDSYSGYSQIPISSDDQEKTTFTCPYGTYAYRLMPFGLCNAAASFQECILNIFKDYVENIMEVLLNNFMVYGSTFDKCIYYIIKTTNNWYRLIKNCARETYVSD